MPLPLLYLLALLLSLFCFPLVSAAQQEAAKTTKPQLNLGILNWADNNLPLVNWQASLKHLQANLPSYEVQLHWLTLEEIEAALAASKLDYLITNPGQYVELSTSYSLAPLATLNEPVGSYLTPTVASTLFVKKTSHLTNLADLINPKIKIGAVSAKAFGGFQLILNEFSLAHLKPSKENFIFTGFPMQQLFNELDTNRVDAIIVRACLAEYLAEAGLINLSDYKVINSSIKEEKCLASTSFYPSWPFLSTGTQAAAVNKQILQALFLDTNEDFWLAPLNYQKVYEVFANLRLGPYEAFQPPNWLSLVYTHKLWISILGSSFLILLLHNLRARYLILATSRKLKYAMQKQQHHQQEINHLSKFALMGEFTSGLAHELNQPLTSILNYAQGSSQLLAHQPLNSQQQEALQLAANKIAQQAEQAAAVIKNLRNFLRKSSSKQEILSANQLLIEAAELIETRVNYAGAHLTLKLAKSNPQINAARVEVLQILLNLLTNSLDAMQTSSIKQLVLSLEVDAVNKRVRFNLVDTGEGFKVEDETKLFAPFYTSRPQGMGLGLNLSQKLAEAAGAQLKLTNLASGGCLASLEWPYAQS